jgi:hypothetical protein
MVRVKRKTNRAKKTVDELTVGQTKTVQPQQPFQVASLPPAPRLPRKFFRRKSNRAKKTVDSDELMQGQLLVSRQAACKILGNISKITLSRLEEAGVLRGIRLNKTSAVSKVFYRMKDLRALAEDDR